MRHGAIIYRSNSLIATGINSSRVQNKYVGFMEDKPPAYHAEEKAIMNARATIGSNDLSGMVLYVARSYKNGKAAMSAPCQKCQALIKEAGIKKVVFTVGELNDD